MKAEFSGIDELILSMKQIAELPDAIADEMLNAGADVLVETQKSVAREMLKGPYATGETAREIKKGKVKLRDDQHVIHVTPAGSRKRGGAKKPTRNAEIMFINEYGARHVKARPVIRTANEKSADAVAKAELEIYDRFLKEKGL